MTLLLALLAAAAAALATRGLLGLALAFRLRVLHGLHPHAADGAAPDDPEPLNRPFSERVLRPALGMVGGLLSRLIPARLMESTAALVRRAGLRGRPADWLAGRALAAAGLGAYTLLVTARLTAGPLLAMAAAVFGWSIPGMYLQSRARRRALRLRDDLPDGMDLLTVCVEAGLGFDQAMTRVVERFPGPLGAELGRVLRDQRLGTPRRQAMLAILERVELPELRSFVHAVLQAEELGVRIGTVLRVQSDSLREQRRQRAEESALKAPIKMAFPMIFLILPALFLVVLGPAALLGFRALQVARP